MSIAFFYTELRREGDFEGGKHEPSRYLYLLTFPITKKEKKSFLFKFVGKKTCNFNFTPHKWYVHLSAGTLLVTKET